MTKQSYEPLSKEELRAIKEGDIIQRMLAFCIPVYLRVDEVTEDSIKAGWVFDRHTGLEIDEYIPITVSYIRQVMSPEEADALIAANKIVSL